MTPTLRGMLDQIDQFLAGPEGGDLAAVLSALRGPDNGDDMVKNRTTNHIRRAAFPVMAATSNERGERQPHAVEPSGSR